MLLRICTTVILCLIASQLAEAQRSGESDQIGISVAYSPTSFKAWGTIQNTRQFYINAEFNHTSISLGRTEMQVGSGVILTGWIRFPSNGISGPKESRTGFGLAPLIIKVPFSQQRHTPFFTISAGMIMTNIHFPNHLGSRFNYLLDAGLGYHIQTSDNYALQVGYKIHHLSNGNQSLENPGIDSHMFFARFLFDI
ncbi:MAG: acyloxyacyl hydrolase [Balneolaceae bacterium]|nr:acyloxyacyl hydrolase [Balneolaceae bacterium]